MSIQTRTQFCNHVADKGREIMEIIVHCCLNIPKIKMNIAKAYVTW
jgi:hypothetical protein